MHKSRPLLLVAALLVASVAGTTSARADSTPPVPVITVSPALKAAVSVAFNESVRGVSARNVVLRVGGTTVDLAARVTCKDAQKAAAGCSSGPVRTVTLKPSAALIAGQIYTAIVNPSGATPLTDLSSNAAATTTKTYRASLVEEETSAAVTYAWRTVSDSAAYDGSYVQERHAGAKAIFNFTGTSVTWYTRTGPDQGTASMFVDGARKATINNFAAAVTAHVGRRVTGLTNARHQLTVLVSGEKGSPAATGQWVSVDSFGVNGARAASPVVTYRWASVSSSSASGGREVVTDAGGMRAIFTFRGKGVDWYSSTGPDRGTARILIDGTLKKTVDDYAATATSGVAHGIAGLTDAVHTITIAPLGSKQSASGGTAITVDRFVVRYPSVASFRRLGAWVDHFDYGLNIAGAISAMDAHAVKTLYLETARYNSTSAFDYPDKVGEWIERAHAAGMKVVGWYLPAYSEYLDDDVSRTASIATYRSPAGQGFDALGVDIELKSKTSSAQEFNDGIKTHLARVRAKVGNRFPIAAIVPSPVAMEINPSHWTGFPWSTIGRYGDIVMPMAYWSYRTDCDTKPEHCPYEYARGNISKSRSFTTLPVHVIGGVGNNVTAQEVAEFVRGSRDQRAYGGGLYDYRTTSSSFWSSLERLNSL